MTITKKLLEAAELYNRHEGRVSMASAEIGVNPSTFSARVRVLRVQHPELLKTFGTDNRRNNVVASDEEVMRSINALSVSKGNISEAARLIGINRATVSSHAEIAEKRGLFATTGREDARVAKTYPIPSKGAARYIVTSAQAGTALHDPTWNSLQAMAKHQKAQILVGTFTYNRAAEGSAKRGAAKRAHDDAWYDPRIEPFVCDEMTAPAPRLIWNGHMNILPTAVDPLSAMQNYNGRASSIFPHAQQSMQSVATQQRESAKLQYTTGAITLRNYIQKKSGQKAETVHTYGALIVEVDTKGHWFVRQLTSDAKGRICDLDVVSYPDGKVEPILGIEAAIWGDVHVAQLEPEMVELIWGEKGLARILKPRYQMMHDVLDFESQSHHNRKNPHKRYSLHVKGRDGVAAELHDVREFLNYSRVDGCTSVVVQSNHDAHLERWLGETDWRDDMQNAEFYIDAQQAYLKAIRDGSDFNALKWAVTREDKLKHVRWLASDEPFVVCKSANRDGIELGLHGDKGPNGARGSLRNLSRLGRPVVIGHSHSAGIYAGQAWQTGVTARMNMDYASGPSSWTQSHVIVHRNGARQLITMYDGKYRA